MSTANILEIFQSIQGEGKYAGVKQVFVRFYECNMHCVWCDTPHSIGDNVKYHNSESHDQTTQVMSRRYQEYTLDEIWKEILRPLGKLPFCKPHRWRATGAKGFY